MRLHGFVKRGCFPVFFSDIFLLIQLIQKCFMSRRYEMVLIVKFRTSTAEFAAFSCSKFYAISYEAWFSNLRLSILTYVNIILRTISILNLPWQEATFDFSRFRPGISIITDDKIDKITWWRDTKHFHGPLFQVTHYYFGPSCLE